MGGVATELEEREITNRLRPQVKRKKISLNYEKNILKWTRNGICFLFLVKYSVPQSSPSSNALRATANGMNTQQYLIVRKFSLSFDGKRWKKLGFSSTSSCSSSSSFFLWMLLDNGNKNGYKIMINGASILFIFSFVWDFSWDRFLQDVLPSGPDDWNFN